MSTSSTSVKTENKTIPMPLHAGLVESFKYAMLALNMDSNVVLNNAVCELNTLLDRRKLGFKHVFLPVNSETNEIVDPKVFQEKKDLSPIEGLLQDSVLSAKEYEEVTSRFKKNSEVSIKMMIEARMQDYEHRYNDDFSFPSLSTSEESYIESVAKINGCTCISLLNEAMAFYLVYFKCSQEKLDEEGKYRMQLFLKSEDGTCTPVSYFK